MKPGEEEAVAGAPFELVIFDVDGTLHDTFRWWGPVIREAVRRFGEQVGRELPQPDDEAAHQVVGMKDEGVWGPFLPADLRARWPELRDIAVPLEVVEVRREDHLFPGAAALLETLRHAGVATALASNCRSSYFTAVCEGQRLGPLTDWQFCLDSPGVIDKTDMLREAMRAAGTERAVMVGDREPDRDAARALGLPFVWRTNPRCDLGEGSSVWRGGVEELLSLLRVR